MSHGLSFFARRTGLAGGLIPPLCMLLSACGGGGSAGVASLPPPPPTPAPTPTPTPTPPPTGLAQGTVIVEPSVNVTFPTGTTIDVQESWLNSPATRVGNSDLIGRLTLDPDSGPTATRTYRAVSGGEFTMTVANANTGGLTYTLNTPPGLVAANLTKLEVQSPRVSWDINLPPSASYRYTNPYGDQVQVLGQRLTAFAKEPGGTETQFLTYDLTRAAVGSPTGSDKSQPQATLYYDIGFSYVAMGEWAWSVLPDGNPANATRFGRLLFVNGDRTPASGIPASGTATYDARSLELRSSSGTVGIPFTLTADFGLRTIATRIDQDFTNFGSTDDPDPIQGIHVGGSTAFSNDGSFDIPLSGTVNYSYMNGPPPPAEAATGTMNGAFFGPQAEQVGGTFFLQRTGDQAPLYQDAFVGQQRPH